jgi:hypothetical protein
MHKHTTIMSATHDEPPTYMDRNCKEIMPRGEQCQIIIARSRRIWIFIQKHKVGRKGCKTQNNAFKNRRWSRSSKIAVKGQSWARLPHGTPTNPPPHSSRTRTEYLLYQSSYLLVGHHQVQEIFSHDMNSDTEGRLLECVWLWHKYDSQHLPLIHRRHRRWTISSQPTCSI